MNLEKQKAFLIHFLFIAVTLGIIYIGFKYFLPILMPFVIGMLVAAILRKSIDLISKKTHVKRSFVSIFILLVFYSIIVLLAIMVGAKVISFIVELFSKLPGLYAEKLEPALNSVNDDLLTRFPNIEPFLEERLDTINDAIFGYIKSTSESVIGAVTRIATQIPSMIINLIFTIVSSFFFTIDFHKIVDFVLRQLSDEKRQMVIRIKDNIIGTLGKFIKAYATLISITFVELSLGFSILNIPNAILLGVVVAIVDIMPILGTGAILIPWSIIGFVLGNTKIGIGMLIMYLIITAVRQALEPRVVGQQIGLHPVVTLICMFVGVQLLGILGLFMFPIIVTILKKMNDEGTIHLFK